MLSLLENNYYFNGFSKSSGYFCLTDSVTAGFLLFISSNITFTQEYYFMCFGNPDLIMLIVIAKYKQYFKKISMKLSY